MASVERGHVLLLFRASCVIIKGVRFKCVGEHVCQQGTLWQHGEDGAVMTLHHALNREKYKRASGNEAVVFLSQAILLPSIYISESVAH